MAQMTTLPPGFRFRPTDVELILYYLKRKNMGRKLHFEAIAEVDIYEFFPSDLPDKSCLKSKDLEWYFFCPREKKYASGVRVKRSTKDGFWKITGRDRRIRFKEKTVGTVKTLVFHIGHAPRGERTDWVMYEYRILDDQLAAAGVQDKFVLCKIFKKAGPGPKNGAEYGAPFNEEDWSDDDVDDVQNHAIPLAFDEPSPTAPMQLEKHTCPCITGLVTPGSVSGLAVTKECPLLSAVHSSSDVLQDETDDEVARLLGQFTDDDMLLLNENAVTQEPIQKVIAAIPLTSDGPSQTALMQLEKQNTGLFTTGGTSGLPVTEEGPLPSAVHSTSEVFLGETDEEIAHLLYQFTDDDMLLLNENAVNQQEKQTCPVITGLFTPGSASGLPVTDEGPLISAGHSTGEVLMGETNDEIACLLGQFTDDNTLLLGENAINQVNDQFHSRSNAAYDEFFALGQPGNRAGHVRRYGNS